MVMLRTICQLESGGWFGITDYRLSNGGAARVPIYGISHADVVQQASAIVDGFKTDPGMPPPGRRSYRQPGEEGMTSQQVRGQRMLEACKRGDSSYEEQIALRRMAAGRCMYCGSDAPLVIDHRVPVCRGGSNAMTNLAMVCHPCNTKKGTLTLDEWRAACLARWSGAGSIYHSA